MATLTNRTIRSTYDQLLQLEDNLIQDGFGTHSLSGSYNLTGSQFISGNLHINGTASIDVLVASYESSSIIFTSGSTKFGDDTSDTHEFTGSVLISGSAFSTNWSGSFTGSFIGLADSASNFWTSKYLIVLFLSKSIARFLLLIKFIIVISLSVYFDLSSKRAASILLKA